MSNTHFVVLSAISCVTGLYLYKKTSPSRLSVGLLFVMTFSSIVLFLFYGVAFYFSGKGIDDATIYHLRYGLAGAGFMEYRGVILATGTALLISTAYLFRFFSAGTSGVRSSAIKSASSYSLLSMSLVLNPASRDIYNLQLFYQLFPEESDPQSFAAFYRHYRKPFIETSNKNKKNLVFIYAESLERTYFDDTLFPDLIHGLRELEKKSIYFTNIKQVTGTGWTVAGMTASQCGIPLFTPSHGNSMSGMDQFLSAAVCLGDLLNEQGYHLNFVGGASLDFAGKGKLLKTHGFTDVRGQNELLSELDDATYKTTWGLYDDSLFDIVYRRFTDLSSTNKQFGLFALTLGTHHPNGHLSKSCKHIKYKDGSNPILNAVACSDYLISNFIKKILSSPYAERTVVVLASDHLAMRNTAYDLLQTRTRRNSFMILDPSARKSREIRTVGSTLDIGSTLLPFIGYTGSIGLGRNLLEKAESVKDRRFIHANGNRSRPMACQGRVKS